MHKAYEQTHLIQLTRAYTCAGAGAGTAHTQRRCTSALLVRTAAAVKEYDGWLSE